MPIFSPFTLSTQGTEAHMHHFSLVKRLLTTPEGVLTSVKNIYRLLQCQDILPTKPLQQLNSIFNSFLSLATRPFLQLLFRPLFRGFCLFLIKRIMIDQNLKGVPKGSHNHQEISSSRMFSNFKTILNIKISCGNSVVNNLSFFIDSRLN